MLKMKNETYDFLRWLSTVVLPALGTLYFALSGIWGFPYGEQIVGTITALVTFFGVILGISKYQHKKPYEMNIDDLAYIDDEEVEAKEV